MLSPRSAPPAYKQQSIPESFVALYFESDLADLADLACATITHTMQSPCCVFTHLCICQVLISTHTASEATCCAASLLSLVLPLSVLYSRQPASTQKALKDPPTFAVTGGTASLHTGEALTVFFVVCRHRVGVLWQCPPLWFCPRTAP